MSTLALAGLACVSLGADAAASVDVVVGLGGRIVSDRSTFFSVSSTLAFKDAVSLRISQVVGDAWRGETRTAFDVPLAVSDSGDGEAVVPVFGDSAAVRVEVAAADGRVLATREIDLRAVNEDRPFPVTVGDFPHPFRDRAVGMSPAHLPRDGFAYSAAESVWIGRSPDGLSAGSWDALARWVVSGGTLVVFTGADFFLLDAPRLREILPVSEPQVVDRGNGVRVLTGRLRADAKVLLSEGGEPWLIRGQYGAGTVLLVTVDAFSIDGADVGELARHVPPAQLLSTTGAAATLLDEQPVGHPEVWAVLALVALAASALSLVVARSSGRRSLAWSLVGVFAVLSLLSSAYAGPSRSISDVYQTDAKLLIYNSRSSLGVSISSSALFSALRQRAAVSVDVGGVPSETLPSRPGQGDYDISYRGGTTEVQIGPGERRLLCSEAAVAADLVARMSGDEAVHVKSRLPARLTDALLLVDGQAFLLPAVERRETVVYPANPLPQDAVHLGTPGGSLDLLFATAARTLPLAQGAWIVAGKIAETRRATAEGRTQKREVSLYVVEIARD